MKTINIKVPRGWHELDDRQLRYLFGLLADDYSSAEIRTLCLFRWSGLNSCANERKSKFSWLLPSAAKNARGLKVLYRHNLDFVVRLGSEEFTLTVTKVTDAIEALKWLDEIPSFPVRLSHIGQFTALPADFLSVPFEKYIYCDNLYQGYLHTNDDSLIDEMMKVLYSGREARHPIRLTQCERISIFYWFASLKQYFAKTFPHFFQQTGGTDNNLLGNAKSIAQQVKDAMNAQIRALTKGDITKEKEVLAMDCWRALTELDAIARETEELNRKYNNK